MFHHGLLKTRGFIFYIEKKKKKKKKKKESKAEKICRYKYCIGEHQNIKHYYMVCMQYDKYNTIAAIKIIMLS